MIRIRQRRQNRQISLPRMRGDDPVLGQLKAGVKEFAPQSCEARWRPFARMRGDDPEKLWNVELLP